MLFKCYNQILSFKNLKKNIGFYFGGSILLIDIVLCLAFSSKGFDYIYHQLYLKFVLINKNKQTHLEYTTVETNTERGKITIYIKHVDTTNTKKKSEEDEEPGNSKETESVKQFHKGDNKEEINIQIDPNELNKCSYDYALSNDKRSIFNFLYSFFLEKVEIFKYCILPRFI